MNKFFSISDIDQHEAATDKSALAVSQFIKSHMHKVGSVSDLSGKLPGFGEAFFIWTVNQFNAFTFIPYVLSQVDKIDELVISTYSVNIRIIDALSAFLMDKKIDDVFILISDSAKFRIPKVVDHLEQFRISFPNVRIRYAWNHSKITLMRCENDHYLLEGSGNFSENARHEQYLLFNSREIYEFRKQWIFNDIHGRSS
jgi:hypothetical protein